MPRTDILQRAAPRFDFYNKICYTEFIDFLFSFPCPAAGKTKILL